MPHPNPETARRPVEEPAARLPADAPAETSDADLERVMTLVPNGAMALCGVAVALLLLGWFYVYFGIFLPRGSIG